MAAETTITTLNFNDNIPGNKFADPKNELEVIMGYVSGLPLLYDDVALYNRGLAIALFEKGVGQDVLDKWCQKLAEDCAVEEFEILVTKGDYPFDRRWYIIGDIVALIDFAKLGKITLPFSPGVYNHILGILERYA